MDEAVDEPVDERARQRTALGRGAAWLFEQRPPRAEHPFAPEPEAEPVPPPVPQTQPDVPAEPDSEPDSDAAPESAVKIRPRPYAGAPVKLVPEHPGDTFFTRTEAEDDKLAHEEERAERERNREQKKAQKKAQRSVPKRSRRERKPLPRGVRALVRTVVVVAVAVLAAVLLRAYVVQPYYVPSQSMEPTLHGCPGCNNDHVLVEKLSYRFHDVQPADIVVFHRPSTWHIPDPVLIKRVIGVSGDKIVLRDGQVYRNGSRLDEPYVNQRCRHGTTDKNGSNAVHRYATIPNGDVFVMGDNRCDSEDSRWFGVVPVDKIIGRAFLIFWPVHRIHSL